ncbi:hypothetical protein ACFL2E_11560 [Thermodesulfobacteriota bacterium]
MFPFVPQTHSVGDNRSVINLLLISPAVSIGIWVIHLNPVIIDLAVDDIFIVDVVNTRIGVIANLRRIELFRADIFPEISTGVPIAVDAIAGGSVNIVPMRFRTVILGVGSAPRWDETGSVGIHKWIAEYVEEAE